MIKEAIAHEIGGALKALMNEGKLEADALAYLSRMSVERPKNPLHGDFSTNIAMLLAKSAQKPPRDIAQLLLSQLSSSIFDKTEIAGPGFINLTLNNQFLSTVLPAIVREKEAYGKTKRSPAPKALVEFVSANPTGGLHLGHARGAFAGDALARMLDAAGYEVSKEFYVNDAGNQVEVLARTIHKRYRALFGEDVEIGPGEYPGSYVIDIAEALKRIDGDKWLNQPESVWLKPLIKFGVDYNLALIQRSLTSLDINFDSWFHERVLHESGALEEVFKVYEDRGMLYEANEAIGTADKVRRADSKAAQYAHQQQGGWFVKTSMFGDEEDRIIRRKDGRFVYLTADISYHHQKFLRGFDLIVDVFGADHAGHITRIKACMEALGHDIKKMRFAVVQMMRLLKDGQEVKFSKRAGEIVGIDELIDEVGADVARFIFLMRSLNSQFDLDLASVMTQSHENPVFYVQYGHARMATILEKAKEKGISVDPLAFDENNMRSLSLPEERELLLKIAELPEVVLDAAEHLEPHRLIYFSQDLIKSFHSYFTKYRHSEKIISDDIDKTKARLSLVFALKLTIHNALQILGLSAPDYMELAEPEAGV